MLSQEVYPSASVLPPRKGNSSFFRKTLAPFILLLDFSQTLTSLKQAPYLLPSFPQLITCREGLLVVSQQMLNELVLHPSRKCKTHQYASTASEMKSSESMELVSRMQIIHPSTWYIHSACQVPPGTSVCAAG